MGSMMLFPWRLQRDGLRHREIDVRIEHLFFVPSTSGGGENSFDCDVRNLSFFSLFPFINSREKRHSRRGFSPLFCCCYSGWRRRVRECPQVLSLSLSSRWRALAEQGREALSLAEERINRRHHRRRRRRRLALALPLLLLLLQLPRRPLEFQQGEAASAPLEEGRRAWLSAEQRQLQQEQQLLRRSHLAAAARRRRRQRRRPRPLGSPPLLPRLLPRRSALAPRRSLEEEEQTLQPLLALEALEAGQHRQQQRLQLLRLGLVPLPPLLPKLLLPLRPLLSPPPSPLARPLPPLAPLLLEV